MQTCFVEDSPWIQRNPSEQMFRETKSKKTDTTKTIQNDATNVQNCVENKLKKKKKTLCNCANQDADIILENFSGSGKTTNKLVFKQIYSG